MGKPVTTSQARGRVDPFAIAALVLAIAPCCPPLNLIGVGLGGWRWRVNHLRGHGVSRLIAKGACLLGVVVAIANAGLALGLERRLTGAVEPVARAAVETALRSKEFSQSPLGVVGDSPRLTMQSSELGEQAGWLLSFSSRWRLDAEGPPLFLECRGTFQPSAAGILPVPVADLVRLQLGDGTVIEWQPDR